jgi:glutathione S-transferase
MFGRPRSSCENSVRVARVDPQAKPKLYMFPGSHPCECAEAAFRLKRISYTRVNLIPAFHKLVIRSHFEGDTVPALALNGERIVGSRAILRRLDEFQPEPRLLPEDPELRARVEEAEAWGDEVLQPLMRRLAWVGLRRDTNAMLSYAAEAKMPLPTALLKLGAKPVAAVAWRLNKATDEQALADLRTLPALLDQVEAWMDEGLIGGETPNVADLQIGATIRLLGTYEDLAPLIRGRRCVKLGQAGFAPAVGRIPAGTLPPDWIPALR